MTLLAVRSAEWGLVGRQSEFSLTPALSPRRGSPKDRQAGTSYFATAASDFPCPEPAVQPGEDVRASSSSMRDWIMALLGGLTQ
jgi:hypothetical protein